MGRRGRKKRTSNDGTMGKGGFTSAQLALIEDYLRAFKECDDEPVDNETHSNHYFTKCTRIADDVLFPKLVRDDTFFACLPTCLSSKQRRCVHEICTIVGLFHDSIDVPEEGDTPGGRACVIARRYDAFNSLLDSGQLDNSSASKRQLPISIRMVKPWFYRRHTNSNGIDTSAVINQSRKKFIWKEDIYVRAHTKRKCEDVFKFMNNEKNIQAFFELHESVSNNFDLSYVMDIESTPFLFVDTPSKLMQCIKEVRFHKFISFDLEMFNRSKFFGSTCLFQLATVEKDYVIDVLAPGIWDLIGAYLGEIFSDPTITKIGHGIQGNDTTSLHRDFGIIVVNVFDTCKK